MEVRLLLCISFEGHGQWEPPTSDGNLETPVHTGAEGARRNATLSGKGQTDRTLPLRTRPISAFDRSAAILCGAPIVFLWLAVFQPPSEEKFEKEGEIRMALIESINSAINGFVWGVPMLVLLVGTGILMTLRTRGVQFRKFGYAMKNTIGKIFHKTAAGKGEMTPFQAMSTALAGTVGTGNIAGITTAVTLGGPGAIFWLWITALIGMCTKYAEVTLAVKFRERNKHGDWVGGPMYYIKNGLGKNWKWLGILFSIFAALVAFGIGNAVQVGNIVTSVNDVIVAFNPGFSEESQSVVNLVLGIALAVLTAVVLFGGIKRLGAVTERLVPVMALIYIVCRLIVVIYYADTPACCVP